jgi:AbrB family looped-hinge helix DNA binding protein
MTALTRHGVGRRIDRLGRIVIPAEIRQALALVPGDYVTFEIEGGAIVLRPGGAPCPTCGVPRR